MIFATDDFFHESQSFHIFAIQISIETTNEEQVKILFVVKSLKIPWVLEPVAKYLRLGLIEPNRQIRFGGEETRQAVHIKAKSLPFARKRNLILFCTCSLG